MTKKLLSKMEEERKITLKILQINLQHSRAASSNLIQLMEQNEIDMALVQEPYQLNNKVKGIPSTYRILEQGSGRKRSAIIVKNEELNPILISQLSNEDTVVIQINYKSLQMYAVSAYFDINNDIEISLNYLNEIIELTEKNPFLIAIDGNSRSKMWFDSVTNSRGRKMEEFITTQDIYLMNEYSEITTFDNGRGKSNIDLTLVSHQLVQNVEKWKIEEEESCSDHRILSYNIELEKARIVKINHSRRRFIVQDKWEDFDRNIKEAFMKLMNITIGDIETEEDEELRRKLAAEINFPSFINKYTEAINTACERSFKYKNQKNIQKEGQTVPWWSRELTIMRKKVNALRRRYQRTRNNEALREERKIMYADERNNYINKIKKQKIQSWKEYCNISSKTNPWSMVYKMAAGKVKKKFTLTTIKEESGEYTKDTESTLKRMMQEFNPEDRENEDSESQRQIRKEIKEKIHTEDDENFLQEEIEQILINMNSKKAPGEDGITSDILLRIFINFPLFITEIYNQCLKREIFPDKWKVAIIIPIVKPGKENSHEVNKYRPISLINIAGKVLEKLMINRITTFANTNNYMNENQFGFVKNKGATEAILQLKSFVEDSFIEKKVVVMTSLDVKGAFNAAWWPAIIKALKDYNCPKNLYNLARKYFCNRKAIIEENGVKLEQTVSRGCPQGSCCGPGFWNIQYNSLLNLKYESNTKVIAFADDVIFLTKGQSVLEAENKMNIEMQKVMRWAESNKICFNENKSQVMLFTRKRSLLQKEIRIYLNYEKLNQVNMIKYLGIYIDNQLTFNNHVHYITEKSCKLVHCLAKSAKITWGIRQEALNIIYKGAIIPILSYGVPVWETALKKKENQSKIRRVQRLINIKILKGFKTISYEASCILTGNKPVIIKLEEISRIYTKLKVGDSTEIIHREETSRSRKRAINSAENEVSEEKWQSEWSNSEKGPVTKKFFPDVRKRLSCKLPYSPKLTTILSGHGKLNSYYYKFKIKDSARCRCGAENQTVEHLIFNCPIIKNIRHELIENIAQNNGQWPVTETDLVELYKKYFVDFVEKIDFENLM